MSVAMKAAPMGGESMGWRGVQAALSAGVLGLAGYYMSAGWKSPSVPTRPSLASMEMAGFVVLLAMVWFSSSTAWIIARATWQETIRKRVLNVILLVGLLLVGSAQSFSWMSKGEEEKFIRDFGLGAILLVAIIIAIVMTSMMIPQEIERRTVFTILSKPVDRFQYIFGKFIGTCLTLGTNLFILGIFFCLVYGLKRRGVSGVDVMGESFKNMQAITMIFFEVTVVAAFCTMVSVLSTSVIFTIACGFFVFFAGQMSSSFQHLEEHSEAAWQKAIQAVYLILPRLDNYDVREKLIIDEPIFFNYMWHAIAAGLVYTAAVLVLSRLFFNDREF